MRERRLTLVQAVSLNMSMMVGIGPFITIPSIVLAMGGPQAMVGWVLGALIALCDGMVWSELAAAFPGSGGTYHFYQAAYGQSRLGRLLRFVFVWQFVFSGPLEAATGAIGVAKYMGHFWPRLEQPAWRPRSLGLAVPGMVAWDQLLAVAIMALATWLAYRRIERIGRLLVVLWVGMLATIVWVTATALWHFEPGRALDYPVDAWRLDGSSARGLGLALSIALYDYLGYYQVCYLGAEVEEGARTIPRSILISVVAIAVLYLVMNLGILGAMPWREVAESKHIASDLMARVQGPWAANLVTTMIIWTAFAATFTAILGYSRIPYAAARSGDFFGYFAETHPQGRFPHRALVLVGGIAAAACLFSLGTVIQALLSTRILIQFVGQIATLWRLRATTPGRMPFRTPLYPVPALLALAGWLYVFCSAEWQVIGYGLVTLALGAIGFLGWDSRRRRSREPLLENG